MITSEKFWLAVTVGVLVGVWSLLYVWVEYEHVRALMIIMAIYGALRARISSEDRERTDTGS